MDSVAGMLSRYGDLAKSPQTRRSYYSEIIGYAWQLGRYDLGRAILDKLEGHFERNGLLNAQTLPERTVSGTYAMTGSHGAALKQAEKDAAAGKWDQAIAVYEAAGKAVDPQDPQRPWLLGRAQELRWQKQFESGQWVSLTPDNQLAGWSTIAGQFQSDGKKITGTPDAFGAQLVCGCKFGRRWELTATVTVDPADLAPNATDGGLLFYWSAVRQLVGLTVSPGRQQMVYQYAATAAPYRRRVEHVSQFHVWVIDGKVEAIIGHQLAIPYRELGVPESPDSRVAIGSLLHDAVGSFQITDLKIHKLTQPPPGWGTLPPNQR
jgi:hypothetical protein